MKKRKVDPLPKKWVEATYETLLKADGKTKFDGREIATKYGINKMLPVNALKHFCTVVSTSPVIYKYEKDSLPSEEECKAFFRQHRDFQRRAAARSVSKKNGPGRANNEQAAPFSAKYNYVDIIIELANKGIDTEMIRYISEYIPK